MPTAQKKQTIRQAKEWYSQSLGFVFTDYRGLKVKEMQSLRRELREKGAEIHVVKNTLFRLAAGDDIDKIPAEFHNGPTAVAFVFSNESECAKVLVDYAASSKKLVVKGGFFGGKVFDYKGVEALSKLPSRDILIAQVIGAIAAPLSNLVGVVEALYADPIRVIGAVADKVAEGSPLPEPRPESASSEPAVADAEAQPAAEAPTPTETTSESAPEAPAETETPASD